jgi:hypothetical protein
MQGQGHVGRTGPPLIAGYLPLIVVSVLIVIMVWLAPSQVDDADGETSLTQSAGAGPGDGARQPSFDEGEEGTTVTGWGDTVEPCEDREQQEEIFEYSPPCFTFTGGNGGATAEGVTEDTIRVSYRNLADSGHLILTMSTLAGIPLDETPEDLLRTTEALVDYVNETFEFYGREIELVGYDGGGNLLDELLGAGQEGASTDARRVTQREVFADLTGFSQPYAEQLAHQGVITIGAPYMSRAWFEERGPLAWSSFPDCTLVAERAADVIAHQIMEEPVAVGGFVGDNREVAIVYPSNEQYRTCGEIFQQRIEDAGYDVGEAQTYPMDFGAAAQNASAILDGLQRDHVTTVGYAGDPIMLNALVAEAERQGYEPEWVIAGVGFTDLDLVGQLVAHESGDQWTRAFGVSNSGTPVPFNQIDAYDAYRTVRPEGEEPTVSIDLMYANVLRLAIGIQMAGPELTPETFGQGMYRYPATDGWMGLLDFSPDNHSGLADSRMLVWSPDQISPFNGEPGTWVDDGTRFVDPEDAPTQDELIDLQEAQQ